MNINTDTDTGYKCLLWWWTRQVHYLFNICWKDMIGKYVYRRTANNYSISIIELLYLDENRFELSEGNERFPTLEKAKVAGNYYFIKRINNNNND